MTSKNLRVAIIGAGASGIMSMIKMREAGIEDVTIFEKANDLGGTWRDNRYPGLTCDVPSHLYRYTFEANPDWSYVCSPGAEILAYFRAVAHKYGVVERIKYAHEVIKAEFQDSRWLLETSQGNQGAFDVVLVAAGVLHHPAYPDIKGLQSFAGRSFHTARWDDSCSLEGQRVGIIGTGSTATQIVSAIVGQVAKLSLFQRTAQWIMPLPNPPISEEKKAQYRADPARLQSKYQQLAFDFNSNFAAAVVGANPAVYEAMAQACLENLENSIIDPVLREQLRPDYKVGCKRLIMSDGFYRAIAQPNAELVTQRIEQVEPDGVRTADGRLHPLDVLVLATGFDTHQFIRPMKVIGRDGISLDQIWANGNQGYRGVTVPGLPNWFMIGGPNSPIGNFSWLMTAEHQFNYAMKLIDELRLGHCTAIAPKPAAARAFNEAIKAKMPDTVWASGCSSWYIDKNGQVASWPWTYEKFQADMQAPILEDFERT
jgi:cation diffusion facilitator CzcD-associated flavoprotein CzcO